MSKSLIESIAELIEKHFGGSQKETESHEVEVTKSLDDEQRMALFVVLEPDVVDLHGDTYDAQEVEKACHNFNTYCRKANIFHAAETEDAQIVESYIAPTTFSLEDGTTVTKGTWLQWWKFPQTEVGEALWDGVKAGDFNGVSIGAKALTENLDD